MYDDTNTKTNTLNFVTTNYFVLIFIELKQIKVKKFLEKNRYELT